MTPFIWAITGLVAIYVGTLLLIPPGLTRRRWAITGLVAIYVAILIYWSCSWHN